jgi:hypothetical protein
MRVRIRTRRLSTLRAKSFYKSLDDFAASCGMRRVKCKPATIEIDGVKFDLPRGWGGGIFVKRSVAQGVK